MVSDNSYNNIYSEEFAEVISAPPSWILSWGIILLALICLGMFVGSWIIEYPDIIEVPIIVTADNKPRSVVNLKQGRLEQLMVKNGTNVNRGQPLAYLQSSADASQVISLNARVDTIAQIISEGKWKSVQRFDFRDYTSLGEIQSDFQTFIQHLTLLKFSLDGENFEIKRTLLNKDLDDLIAMRRLLEEQLTLQQRDFDLAKEDFSIQEQLYDKKIISSLDFKKEKAKLIAREIPLKNIFASIIQNRSAQTEKERALLELKNSDFEQKSAFAQALQSLRGSISNWIQQHLLVAPVSGRVSFSSPLQERQYFSIGEELMSIEPQHAYFEGLIKIPQINFGKLAIGQIATIKLDGYPYKEYGLLEGRLSEISPDLGKDSLYWGVVRLRNPLVTRYGKSIPYKHGLKGKASIITKNRKFAERIFSIIRNGSE